MIQNILLIVLLLLTQVGAIDNSNNTLSFEKVFTTSFTVFYNNRHLAKLYGIGVFTPE